MNPKPLQTEFFAKTWMFYAQAIIFGFMAAFSAILGPLFLFEIAKDARGKSAVDAGIALSIMSVPFLLFFALAVYNIATRRQPLIELCREGLQFQVIGATTLDKVPFIPGLLRVAWLIFSFQGFRRAILRMPWESLVAARGINSSLGSSLLVAGSVYARDSLDELSREPVANHVTYGDHALKDSLDRVATTINAFAENAEARQFLSSWSGQNR